jgi:LysM repeat protein
MVTVPDWFVRYGLPACFLLLATVVILAARTAIHDGGTVAASPARARTSAPVVPKRAHVRSTRASAYAVRSGDTLATIAERFGTTVDELLALNPGIDPQALRVGQIVRVE